MKIIDLSKSAGNDESPKPIKLRAILYDSGKIDRNIRGVTNKDIAEVVRLSNNTFEVGGNERTCLIRLTHIDGRHFFYLGFWNDGTWEGRGV